MVAAANGVVIATEKKLPSILVDETSVRVYDSFMFNFSSISYDISFTFISFFFHDVSTSFYFLAVLRLVCSNGTCLYSLEIILHHGKNI